MDIARFISKYKQITGISFGIVAAIVILISQSFYYDYVASSTDTGVKTEMADEHEEGRDIVTISKDAVTSAVQLIITHALHFIGDIYFDNSTEFSAQPDQKSDFSTYFKTLFRLIIAPNAP